MATKYVTKYPLLKWPNNNNSQKMSSPFTSPHEVYNGHVASWLAKYENSLTKILELKGRGRRRPLSMTPPLTDLQCGEIYRGGGVKRYLSSFFHKCTPKKVRHIVKN